MAESESINKIMSTIETAMDKKTYQELHWTGTFDDYLKIVLKNPRVARNAFQRVYDMIISYGYEEYTEYRETYIHYNFFKDLVGNGKDAIFGLERNLMSLVNTLKSASHGYGSEHRILLLHGPVGSSKSTIVRLLKRGLEAYSRTKEGVLYTFAWQGVEKEAVWEDCPMHEEPLRLIPQDLRENIVKEINRNLEGTYEIKVAGDLCPSCRRNFNEYMARYNGDWNEVIKHIRVRRLILLEKDRVGIGTFQPKDEKNQDSTELTGDINYRKIA